MNPTRSPDDPRDPHLLAALHNAPDRDAAPTALLSAAILAQARQAVNGAPAVAPSRWRGWQAAWGRLWQPAPMAAFGTMAMAAVIGVMWQGQELPDPTPGLRPQPAATPPTPVGTVSSERAAAAEAAPQPAPRARRDAAANASAPPRPAKGAETQTAQDAAGSAVPTPWPAQAQVQAPKTAAAEVARAAPAESADTAAERREAVGKALTDDARLSARAAAQSQSGRLAAAAASAPIDPLAPAAAALEAASGSDPARVQWRSMQQRALSHDGERRAWWTALQRATEGRWQAAGPSSTRAALTLLIDGAPAGSIAFEPQAVVWTDARGGVWRAPIGSVELRALQEPLARW